MRLMLSTFLLLILSGLPLNASPRSSPMPFPLRELNCLSTVIYHESRGEPFLGQVAVAHVVLNRLEDARWPDTVCAVVYQPKQFTDVAETRPNRESEAWRTAQEVALHAFLGLSADPTEGAKWFYAPEKVPEPKWAGKLDQERLGNHLFLREI